jgi:hypothetical protein
MRENLSEVTGESPLPTFQRITRDRNGERNVKGLRTSSLPNASKARSSGRTARYTSARAVTNLAVGNLKSSTPYPVRAS